MLQPLGSVAVANTAIADVYMNGRDCVLIKLYLQRQTAARFAPEGGCVHQPLVRPVIWMGQRSRQQSNKGD